MSEAWLKGNLHAHSNLSDGDSEPAAVVAWYRDHGYDFLALTDHDELAVVRDAGPLLVVAAEEISSVGAGRPVHVSAFGARERVAPLCGDSVAATVRATVCAACAAGAIPSINHPNFRWALDLEALLAGAGAPLLEIWSGHPAAANHGGVERPSVESLWDQCLTLDRWYWGVAVDDAHHFRTTSPSKANPGRGWVMVRARARTVDSILCALVAGDFYASTGVTLDRLDLSVGRISLAIAGEGPFRTEVIGRGGRVLAEIGGGEVVHEAAPGDGYLRARVTGPSGEHAWTQPVALRPGGA